MNCDIFYDKAFSTFIIASLSGSVYGAFYGFKGFPFKEGVLFNKISEINKLQVDKIVKGLWEIR